MTKPSFTTLICSPVETIGMKTNRYGNKTTDELLALMIRYYEQREKEQHG